MWSEIYPQFLKWGGGFEDFDNALSHDFEDFDTQNETKDLILDSPMETGNLQNFEKAVDQLSVPEQLVTDGKETSGNTELGGEEDPSMHEGVKSPQVN